jgi:LPS-assembly lipoprotein
MQRRLLLGGSLAGSAALALSACGFKLREAPTFAFEAVQLNGIPNGYVTAQLYREMQINDLRVNGMPLPPVILTVQVDQRERVVVGQTAAGQVRELQLRQRFRFNLRTRDERILIEDTELLLERDMSFNETQVLSKDAEEQMLYRDMTNDIAQQVVRRLAAVRQI